MPENWQAATMGEIADVRGGKRLPKGTPWATGPTQRRYIRSIDIKDGSIDVGNLVWVPNHVAPAIDKYRVSEGDVIITIAGKIGETAVVQSELDGENLTENAALIRPKHEGILTDFVHHWLSSPDGQDAIARATVGTSQKKLALVRIKELAIAVPPEREQRRIVDLVESIDNHINALQGQIDATRTAREGVLSELLSNPGDDWQRANLAEVATVVVGPALKSEIYHSCNDGIPVVRGINIGTDGFRWEETVFWPEDECAGYEQFFLTEGQTIIPMDRPFRPNGQLRLAMVQQGDLPLLLNQRVAAIAAGPQISEGFLYAIACSPDFAKKLSGGLTGAYAPHLAKKDFENMSIAIPSMSEQHQITDLVQSFDEQISALETQIDAARATRSGVLSELLSGDRLLDESYDKAVGW